MLLDVWPQCLARVMLLRPAVPGCSARPFRAVACRAWLSRAALRNCAVTST